MKQTELESDATKYFFLKRRKFIAHTFNSVKINKYLIHIYMFHIVGCRVLPTASYEIFRFFKNVWKRKLVLLPKIINILRLKGLNYSSFQILTHGLMIILGSTNPQLQALIWRALLLPCDSTSHHHVVFLSLALCLPLFFLLFYYNISSYVLIVDLYASSFTLLFVRCRYLIWITSIENDWFIF